MTDQSVSTFNETPPLPRVPQVNREPSDVKTDNCTSAENNSDRIEGKFVSPNVCNLSHRVLTEAEISLLTKGLKFCQTPREIDRSQLKNDLERFGRNLRLRWHFRNCEDNFSVNPFKPKSTFHPKNEDVKIEMYLSRIEEEIMAIKAEGSNFSNLSASEKEALKNLRNDNSIVIKEADKGSGVVVWDKEDYLKEAYSQLSDTEVYEECVADPMAGLQDAINDTLSKIENRGDILPATLQYFKEVDGNLGRFYELPKIHKRLKAVPGRPVVSNSGYHTENISAFLDFHLQPLAKKVKSYIKDTNHFLRKLRDLPDLPDDAIFCTLDVTSLYPNIPHDEGLRAIEKALDKREEKVVSTQSLVDLAEVTLKNNYFEFNGKTYKQKQGTAIGTKFAPPYAILFLGDHEEKALSEAELKPWLWWRYIDDVFMIWEHGEESLNSFISYLNSLHPTIKFTSKFSREQIEFLDVLVIKEGNGIKTDLFVKETDTHQYLHFNSCHPFHVKKGIPYGQALRLRRICSNDEDFETRCRELIEWLVNRSFDRGMVTEQVGRAKSMDRDTLLDKENNGEVDTKLNLVVTYHPALNRKIFEILHRNQFIMESDEEHSKVLPEVPRVAFRKPKNLKNILVHAKVRSDDFIEQLGCGGCNGRANCELCRILMESKTFSSQKSGRTFDIRVGRLHCNSTGVVYLLECKTCGLQYVGSSWPRFRLRVNNYKTQQRKYVERRDKGTLHIGTPQPQADLHAHFSQNDHRGIEDFSFKLIDQGKSFAHMRDRESFWQHKLEVLSDGLNTRDVPARW